MCKTLEGKGHEPSRERKDYNMDKNRLLWREQQARDVPGSGAPVEEKQTAVGAAKALVPSWGRGSAYYLLETGSH